METWHKIVGFGLPITLIMGGCAVNLASQKNTEVIKVPSAVKGGAPIEVTPTMVKTRVMTEIVQATQFAAGIEENVQPTEKTAGSLDGMGCAGLGVIGLIGAGFGGFVVRSEIEKARIKAVNSKKNKVRLPMVIKPGQVGPTGYERTPTNGSDFSLRVKNRPSLFSILQGIITRADVKITDGPPDSGVTSIDVRGSITDGDEAEIFFRSPHSSEPRGASKVTRSQRNEHYMNELLDAMKKK